MTLEELKANTACGDCGVKGHWRGDPGRKMMNAHETMRVDLGVRLTIILVAIPGAYTKQATR